MQRIVLARRKVRPVFRPVTHHVPMICHTPDGRIIDGLAYLTIPLPQGTILCRPDDSIPCS